MNALKRVRLMVEELEARWTPAVIAMLPIPPGAAPGSAAAAGLIDISGPGLQNRGELTWAIGAFGVGEVNNDDTGVKQNFYSENARFGRTGYIDAVYRVNDSQINPNDASQLGRSEFRMEVNITNATPDVWTRFRVEIGFGTGNQFVRMSNQGGVSLDLDYPNLTMTNPVPDPITAFLLSGFNPPNFVPASCWPNDVIQLGQTQVNLNRDHGHAMLQATNGFHMPNQTADLFFNIDIPNSNAPGIPNSMKYQNPNGFEFTIRLQPFVNMVPRGIDQPTAPTSGSRLIALSGTGFYSGNVTGVEFDGEPATYFHVVSDTELLALAPPHEAGEVQVAVIWAGGTESTVVADEQGNPVLFEYYDPYLALATSSNPVAAAGDITMIAQLAPEASQTSTDFVLDQQLYANDVLFNGSGAAQTVFYDLEPGYHDVAVATDDGWVYADLVVTEAPGITSPDEYTFLVDDPGGFVVETNADCFPTAAILLDGTLPPGLEWVDNRDGTMTISGSAEPGSGGTYTFDIIADNGDGNPDTQEFTLTVNEPLGFLSEDETHFLLGSSDTFTITAAGFPGELIVSLISGSLPSGLSFDDLGNGIATISGTPAGTAGSYNLTFEVDDGINEPVEQNFTLIVNTAPTIVSITPNANISSLAGNQHSRIASLVVVFNQAVELDAGAMTLALHTNNVSYNGTSYVNGYGTLPTSLSLSTSDNITWIVTFVGNTDNGADGYNSIRDGVYDLLIDASMVHPLGVPQFEMANDYTFVFHRLFGDIHAAYTPAGGTAGVNYAGIDNSGDNLSFQGSLNNPGNYKAWFDFDGDGDVDSSDQTQFSNRFNKELKWAV